MSVQILELKIKIGDTTHDVSLTNARELYSQLHELFGEKVDHTQPKCLMDLPISPAYPIPQPIWGNTSTSAIGVGEIPEKACVNQMICETKSAG